MLHTWVRAMIMILMVPLCTTMYRPCKISRLNPLRCGAQALRTETEHPRPRSLISRGPKLLDSIPRTRARSVVNTVEGGTGRADQSFRHLPLLYLHSQAKFKSFETLVSVFSPIAKIEILQTPPLEEPHPCVCHIASVDVCSTTSGRKPKTHNRSRNETSRSGAL